MASRLSAASFDLEIGFLHSIRYGRKSLAMDIMETFRPSFIDEWILTILNKKQISSEQFLHSSGTSKCMLDKEGFQQFCRLYQKHKEDKVNQKTWAGIFDDEVRRLRRYVMGETDIYQPFIKL